MHSKKAKIHVICLCYTENVKKYGFRRVLREFVDDLKKLEPEEGITIQINGQEFGLCVSIASFCRDSLAIHEVFVLLGPVANKLCRICLIYREQLHDKDLKVREERTKELFEIHYDRLKKAKTAKALENIRTETGVYDESALNESKFYHISENKIFDIMHDFLAGVVPIVQCT